MKFLFLISHGLYLRNYGTLIESLAQAGHEVVLGKTSTKEIDDTGLYHIAEHLQGVRLLAPPARSGWWWAMNDPLRAVRDYLRYLGPEFGDAPKLVERAARRIPGLARRFFEGSHLSTKAPVRKSFSKLLARIDSSTPSDPAVTKWLESVRPDALLITPMVDFDYVQLDFLKAAVSIGMPTALLVASWDNLTNKGEIQILPDMVTVWNEHQRHEAETMHGVPGDRIVVTGAQLFDHWFTMKPSGGRAEFCSRAGALDPERPIILYLCSSSFICPDEVSIVREWLAGLRSSDDELLRAANVIVRPHPSHSAQWAGIELDQPGARCVIWPRIGTSPIDAQRQQDYFDSIHHAGVVVGVNTSGFLEAAIIGRRSLVLRTPETAATQEGTLHFRYLLRDGFLLSDFEQAGHHAQLGRALRGAADDAALLKAFAGDFLRPHGIDRPSLPFLVEAVDSLARQPYRAPAQSPWWYWLIRALLVPVRLAVAPGYKARLARREALTAGEAGGRS